MKRFVCQCGNALFFESWRCLSCGRPVGFATDAMTMVSLAVPSGGAYRPCRNGVEHGVCNWLVASRTAADYCLSCGLNEIVPNLASASNLHSWARVEAAKRRLIYGLLANGLTVGGDPGDPGDAGDPRDRETPSLSFRLLEDQRRNPLVEESVVLTGHYAGTITVNIAEADDSLRHALREQMRERYRTLLGHFRHESGHFYFNTVVAADDEALESFRALFGDERRNYQEAIETHYRGESAAADPASYVSGYAAAHPLEDWAETWAHFLHIADGLETAAAYGLVDDGTTDPASPAWISRWLELSVSLNELNRSLGMDDPYPFPISPRVAEKLMFVRRRVARAGEAAATSASR